MGIHRVALKLVVITLLSLACSACLTGGGGGGGGIVTAGKAAVSVSITSPGASEIDTTDESMSLEGTAGSDARLTSISWKSSHGAEGTASGSDNWRTGAIALELGSNTITVTATDSQNNVASDTIVINRESTEKAAATLSWTAPTEREDGSPLTGLAGYRIHYGRMSEIYDYEIEIDNPGVVTYLVEDLSPGDWYFSVTALDNAGMESELSTEAHTRIL